MSESAEVRGVVEGELKADEWPLEIDAVPWCVETNVVVLLLESLNRGDPGMTPTGNGRHSGPFGPLKRTQL